MLSPLHGQSDTAATAPTRGSGNILYRFAQRSPFLCIFALVVVSNAAGSIFSIFYNTQLIVARHLDEKQTAVFWEVVAPGYNLVAYPICLGIMVYLLWPLMRCRKKLHAGEMVAPAQMQLCRRRLVNLPFCQVCLNFLGWIPGAVIFPWLICWLGGSHNQGTIWLQFVVAFVVAGVFTMVQTFFLMERFLMTFFYPDFFQDERPADVRGVIPIPLWVRLALLWSAVAVMPLVAFLVIALNFDSGGPSLLLPALAAGENRTQGKIERLDGDKRDHVLTVNADDKKYHFQLDAGAKIKVQDRDGKVADLKVGDEVTVTWRRQDNRMAATAIHCQRVVDLTLLAMVVAASGIGSGGLISWIVGRDLILWIQAHDAATEQIATENFDVRIPEKRPDELGRLTDRFNDMAVALGHARQLHDTFGQVVGPEVRDEILDRYPGGQLGGEVQEVTVLFADIRGFTRRSSGEAPERVVELLNRFLTLAAQAVEGKRGLVNKFLGDGIMALFGAPRPRNDHADLAVAAALDMLARLECLNQELARQKQAPLAIGIGIHTGPALVGCVGATLEWPDGRQRIRMEFTAIGETVNLGQRIEQLTKKCGGPILVSEQTRRRLTQSVSLACLGPQEVPGCQEPVIVYQVNAMEAQSAKRGALSAER